MPETIEAPVADFSEAAIGARFNALMNPEPSPEPVVQPEPKAEPKVEQKTEEFPSEFIQGKDKPVEEEDFLTTKPKGPIKHDHFVSLQQQAAKKFEAIKAEMEEWKSKANKAPVVDPEIVSRAEKAEARAREIEEELERANVERSPKFKAEFSAKEDSIRTQIKKTGAELGLDLDTVDSLLSAQGKRRLDLIEDLDLGVTHKSHLATSLAQLDNIQSAKEQYLSQSREVLKEMTLKEQAAEDSRKALERTHETKVFNTVLETMGKTFEPFMKVEGNDGWNKSVEANTAVAKRFMDGEFTTEEFAEVVLAGVGAKTLHKMFQNARTQLIAAREELAGLKAAGTTVPNTQSQPTMDRSKMTLEESAMATFRLAQSGQL